MLIILCDILNIEIKYKTIIQKIKLDFVIIKRQEFNNQFFFKFKFYIFNLCFDFW